ncbi:MAG: CDP-alcohol phosphatidyltransferase family protein [Candidatus Omnitrophica bacterium]|jgi:cardiolipin synthase|nr:CDP-alcohol phosphatidyltransferase family protein [Candidatus Omnitrophota bacterium]MDD4012965.1 CDP-alcohol phosphatidyltransferase family protein [Candidatus Omnitrophota bacterium]
MNWPNRLTVLRILLVPVFITAIVYRRLVFAAVVFLIASITDALDGYLARVLDQRTEFGAMADPLADKLLLNSAFLSFSLVAGLPDHLRMPIYVPIVVISRDAIIMIGVFAITHFNGKVEGRPTVIGKITTFVQMVTILSLLIGFKYSSFFWNITVAVTVVSGLDYVRRGMREINAKS